MYNLDCYHFSILEDGAKYNCRGRKVIIKSSPNNQHNVDVHFFFAVMNL